MTDYEKKITDLIDRATHATTNIDEARNCALQACRLIRKHGFRVTDRELLPGIDIPPSEVWDETVEIAKKEAGERLQNMADSLFGRGFNFADFLGPDEAKKKGVGYILSKASGMTVCHSCHMQIKHGQTILMEFGQNAQKGARRVTCTKERCKASWSR